MDIEFQLSTPFEVIDGAPTERPLRVFRDKKDIPEFLKERIWALAKGDSFFIELELELGFGKRTADLRIEIEIE